MTDLRTAAQQALEALDISLQMMLPKQQSDQARRAAYALRAALAEHDKHLAWFKERKTNWDLQRKLAEETQERDRQQREYEGARLAALPEPVQEPVAWGSGDGYWIRAEDKAIRPDRERFTVAFYTSPPQPPAEPQEQPICDECGRKKADGWALYCVDCMEPVFAPPQRKPLTEEVLDQRYYISTGQMLREQDKRLAFLFARAVEAAHGIKEGT